MAYSLPLVAPTNFILKLKIHCSKCESELKRFLRRIQGVHSANIDAKQGTVAISGTVEPSTIMMILEKGLGLKAEVLWEQNPSSNNGRNLEIVAESRMVDERFNDPNMVAQLQQLSGIKGLKSVEVIYTKQIKLTLKDQNDDFNDKNVEFISRDGSHTPKISHVGGGLCGASTSCCTCGGHHDHVVNQNMNGIIGGCSGNHHAAGYPITCNGNMHWPPHACGCIPPPAPPPPWSGGYSPSAPPMGTVYSDDDRPPPPPPPAMRNSYAHYFSDENTSNSCNIM